MTITAIVKRRRQARYDIYLDGEYYATMSEDSVLSNRLKVGLEVDLHSFAAMVALGERQDAVAYILSVLSSGAYTEHTARDKLVKRGYSQDAVDFAIERMYYYGYIDDHRYAVDYIQQYAATRSRMRIRQDLRQKGVSDAIINPLLSDTSEQDACALSLRRKMRGKVWSAEVKLKLMRSLLQQGFSYDTVMQCVADYANEIADDQ